MPGCKECAKWHLHYLITPDYGRLLRCPAGRTIPKVTWVCTLPALLPFCHHSLPPCPIRIHLAVCELSKDFSLVVPCYGSQ